MRTFWNIVTVVLFVGVFLLVILWLIGCDPYGGPEVRIADGIRVYHLGDYRPDIVNGDDDGRPGTLGIGYAMEYLINGDGVDVGGLNAFTQRSTSGYWNDNGWWYGTDYDVLGVDLPGKITSDRGGVAVFYATSSMDYTLGGGVRADFYVQGRRTLAGPYSAYWQSQRDYGTENPHVPMMQRDAFVVGAYWRSRSSYCDGNYGQPGVVTTMSIDPIDDTLPRLSPDEDAFLAGDLSIDKGFEVHAVQWFRDNGTDVKAPPYIIPFEHCDPDVFREMATPYVASFSLITADPVNILGGSVAGRLFTDTVQDGVDVNITVVAASEDNTRFIARSDYFLPVDAAYYEDTGQTYDVLDKPAYVIAVSEYQRLNIKINDGQTSLFLLADCWLTTNRTADITGDGVVNYRDVNAYFSN